MDLIVGRVVILTALQLKGSGLLVHHRGALQVRESYVTALLTALAYSYECSLCRIESDAEFQIGDCQHA